jgi:DNA invertase Pin-like site-specific DNA recombinase
VVRNLLTTKIGARHHERLAIVYVRQSRPQQVLEHEESRLRQYELAGHATTLGWSEHRVLVIDEDQGQSGRAADHRSGFQRLLTEVTLDHVGVILGLEMSRLARSSKDWHHLLELCALFGTLLGDQDGIYDPNDSNDRLLLGLKGAMSEFELFTMRNRLDRGRLHKAERGELFVSAPLGYLKVPSGQIVLDPDEQARAVIQLVFDKFTEIGSVYGVMHYMVRNQINLGIRPQHGPRRGELVWRRANLATLRKILHHPIYAGAYAFGRCARSSKRRGSGAPRSTGNGRPEDEWNVLLRDRMPAYISWDRYLANRERLRQNLTRLSSRGVARAGSALLAGLLVCGMCGRRFIVHYRHKERPFYRCERHLQQSFERTCYGLNAEGVDELVAKLVHQVLEPASLQLHLRVQEDSQRERQQLEKHWTHRLERARHEAARAERQYQAVEPENRLVGRTLEKQWEAALVALQQVQDDYDRFAQEQLLQLSAESRQQIEALSQDIPALWNAEGTTAADRKEIVRCLVEQVVVHVRPRSEYVDVAIHWQGGFVSQHEVVRPVSTFAHLRDAAQLKARVIELKKAGCTIPNIASTLNDEGFSPPRRCHPFDVRQVWGLLALYGLTTKRDVVQLGPQEWMLGDLAKRLSISREKLREWVRKGWAHGRFTSAQKICVVWADADEVERLRRLQSVSKLGVTGHPPELTTPKKRPKPAI